MTHLRELHRAQESAWAAVLAIGLPSDVEGQISLDIARHRYGRLRNKYEDAVRAEALRAETETA